MILIKGTIAYVKLQLELLCIEHGNINIKELEVNVSDNPERA